jgi:hypothetical protein
MMPWAGGEHHATMRQRTMKTPHKDAPNDCHNGSIDRAIAERGTIPVETPVRAGLFQLRKHNLPARCLNGN